MRSSCMFKTAPTPAVEDVIHIHSMTIIFMLGLFRQEFPNLIKHFSRIGTMSLVVMVAGLCELTRKPTALAIADHLGGLSHDRLTRFLQDTSWSASTLMIALCNQAIAMMRGMPAKSWLILDDVIIAKPFSKVIAGAYWDWDYVNKKNEFCIRLVVLMWTNGLINIPVAFSVWHKQDSAWLKMTKKRYRTKNELARCLIYKVIRRGLSAQYITFDSWYASKENFNFLKRLDMVYYAAVKNNRIFNQTGRRRSCKELAASYKTRQFNYYKNRSFRAKSFTGWLNDVTHEQHLTIVPKYRHSAYFANILPPEEKKKKEKDPNLYIVTNNLNVTTCGSIDCYRRRWRIEVMFRDLKQHLGLTACQHQSMEAIYHHFALCFFGYVAMQYIKKIMVNDTMYEKSWHLTIGDVKTHLQKTTFAMSSKFLQPDQPYSASKEPMSRELMEKLMNPENPVVIRLLNNLNFNPL